MTNKVTIESIVQKIVGEMYIVLPDGRTTVCMLTMKNGYTIKGMSACVDASNFDMNVGRKIAFEDAIHQIWPLEGYLLAERLHEAALREKDPIVAAVRNAQENRRGKANKADSTPYGLKKDGTPKKRPGRAPKEA